MKRLPLLALALVLGTGCVERFVSIKSEPPGARVLVDGQDAGVTPVDVPYVWYGTREVLVLKEGCRSERRLVTLSSPWWQVFPLDLLTDVLIPFTITDRTVVHFRLQPSALDAGDLEAIKRRAAEAREKTGGKRE